MFRFSPVLDNGSLDQRTTRRYDLLVCLFAAVIYLVACISPPALMDDVDAVQAQIARNMLESGDWVTARLNGVAYLEKSPLVYWMMAMSFAIFGVHDWAARLPIALSVDCALLAYASHRTLGVRRRAGILCGTVARDVHRTVSLHAHSDSRRDPDADHHARDVGVPARARGG